MKCLKCIRKATIKNEQYHSGEWLCTFHSNKQVKEGRRKRKYGNRITSTSDKLKTETQS